MAHWDDEQFSTLRPPKDIFCSTCKYKAKPVTVMGKEYDRSGYGMCDKYERKPIEILFDHADCPYYDKE